VAPLISPPNLLQLCTLRRYGCFLANDYSKVPVRIVNPVVRTSEQLLLGGYAQLQESLDLLQGETKLLCPPDETDARDPSAG
jgi:hypothetical protein